MLRRVDRLFYDGDCGLCHGAVRFVARRGESRLEIRYAPLGGSTFEKLIPVAQRTNLPDSLLVLTRDGRLLTRSEGMIYILKRVGGIWPWIGRLLQIVPPRLRNAGYDWIAYRRFRWFPRPSQSCPVPSAEERGRFEP